VAGASNVIVCADGSTIGSTNYGRVSPQGN